MVLIHLAAIAACVAPVSAVAEVSDKILPLSRIWLWSGLGAIAVFAAWRYRRWAGLLVSLPASMVPIATIAEVRDPYVGPAILEEQGWLYGASAYGSLSLIVVAALLGEYARRSSRAKAAS
jgi:hypothetical protein